MKFDNIIGITLLIEEACFNQMSPLSVKPSLLPALITTFRGRWVNKVIYLSQGERKSLTRLQLRLMSRFRSKKTVNLNFSQRQLIARQLDDKVNI